MPVDRLTRCQSLTRRIGRMDGRKGKDAFALVAKLGGKGIGHGVDADGIGRQFDLAPRVQKAGSEIVCRVTPQTDW